MKSYFDRSKQCKGFPRVSVIVPNYNHAQYLDERIQSILNQTYQDFELIILDDSSSDNSRDVIKKYADDKHVTNIIYNEVNSGMTFKQWNKGFQISRGDLIWIAESDDKCETTFLENLVEQFDLHENCVLAYCRSDRFFDDGVSLDNYKLPDYNYFFDGNVYINKFLSKGNDIANASSVLFKRSIVQEINKDYYAYKGAGDRLFWTYIAEKGGVAIVNKRLNHFRQHYTNSTIKYYNIGVNQTEDKKILDYIYRKRYISKLKYYYCKIDYIKSLVVDYEFQNYEVKNRIYGIWEINLIDCILAKFLLNYQKTLNAIKGLLKKLCKTT